MRWSKIGTLRGGAPFARKVDSATSGAFSGTFPAGLFTDPPVVAAVAVSSGGRDLVVTMTSVTASGFAGQVRASRKLPAVVTALAALAGYDPFVEPGAAVSVHITANRAT